MRVYETQMSDLKTMAFFLEKTTRNMSIRAGWKK